MPDDSPAVPLTPMPEPGTANGPVAAVDATHAGGGPAAASVAGTTPAAKKYRASIRTVPGPALPPDFASAVLELEAVMKMPVWLLVQNEDPDEDSDYGMLGSDVARGFFNARDEFGKSGRVALVIESPGGYADDAYRIAKTLRNHAGGFVAIIPHYAKSAATLLTLGADEIVMCKDAELGPLDAQHYDYDDEERGSALNEVQALERLTGDALKALDTTLWFLRMRTKKRVSTILPVATRFVADMMRPLLEKIDTVHFSGMQRMLKVAEAYAVRLLQPRYSKDAAEKIADHLVSQYPEHGFVIDRDEAVGFDLATRVPTDAELGALTRLMPYLKDITAIGRLEEVPTP